MILDKFNLSGKVAIVTGANTGLGMGMAIGLAQAGAKVVGIGRREMKETQEVIEKDNGEFYPIIADLSSIEPVKEIIEKSIEKFGRIDVLVNNAGIIRREDAIDFTEKDWDDVLSVNLKTLFFLSQAFAKQVIEQKSSGRIINIASMLSFQGGIRVPSYTASKSGVMGLTRAMATEWSKHRITVNAIAPGYMVTNNTQAIREDEKRNAAILDRIPAGRWGTIEDLQGACVFLSSEASSYLTGYTIAVDGGWLAR